MAKAAIALLGLAGIAAYVLSKSSSSSAASTLPVTVAVTPTDGVMPTTTIYYGGTVTLVPPAGSSGLAAVPANTLAASTSPVLAAAPYTPTGGGVAFVGATPGGATLTISWKDATGVLHQSSLPVNVVTQTA